jgi:hypothetical protein
LEPPPMTIMTIRIPDDVKAAFDKAFAGEDKDAIIADLIRRAAEEKSSKENEGSSESLVERFRKFRDGTSVKPNAMGNDEVREIREQLRREAGY